MTKMNKKPLVSICCITYNHVNFIKDAVEGFLMQKTNFSIEIIIHDDASTDGTPDIIKHYAQLYPDLIHPLFQKENQYSKIEGQVLTRFVLPTAKGKYIALCEGDDYWTDPNKLQKQVDFLSDNPQYSLSVGGYKELFNNVHGKTVLVNSNNGIDSHYNGFTFTLSDMQSRWITKTLTAVFRKDVIAEIDFSVYKYARDIHFFYHLAKNHKGFYFEEVFGVYRIHEGGVHGMQEGIVRSIAAYNCYKELYEQNRDEYTRKMSYFNTLALLNFCIYNKCNKIMMLRKVMLFFEAIRLIRKFKEVKHLFYVFISPKLKRNLTA